MDTNVDKSTNQKLRKIFEEKPSQKFRKGGVIVGPKDKNTDVLWVKSGLVKAVLNVGANTIEMSIGMGILELSLIFALTGRESIFTLEAVNEVEVVRISRKDFEELLEVDGELRTELLTAMLTQLSLEMELSRKLLALDALGKVAKIVLTVDENKSKVPLTHKLIGNMTGLTRETVTLQLLKLEKMKLVRNKSRKVDILNKAELKKVAGE